MRKLTELNKNEKVMLLKSIAAGEVSLKDLTPDTLFAIEHQDFFMGLLIAGSQIDDSEVTVICLGPAKIAREKLSAHLKEAEKE